MVMIYGYAAYACWLVNCTVVPIIICELLAKFTKSPRTRLVMIALLKFDKWLMTGETTLNLPRKVRFSSHVTVHLIPSRHDEMCVVAESQPTAAEDASLAQQR